MEKPGIDLIFQVALCVEDLDETLRYWKQTFDFDETTIIRKCTRDSFENDGWDGRNYNEKPCEFFHKFCRFSLGGLDFEIIEPLDKTPGNPYSDFLAEHGSGIHHIGVKINDQKLLDENMKQQGVPRYNYAEMGPVLADGSRKSCVFYDLRKTLGVILECGSVVVGPLANDPRAGNPADFISD